MLKLSLMNGVNDEEMLVRIREGVRGYVLDSNLFRQINSQVALHLNIAVNSKF